MADQVSDHRGVTWPVGRSGRPVAKPPTRAVARVVRCGAAASLILASHAHAQVAVPAVVPVQSGNAATSAPQQWQRDLRLDLGVVISDNANLQARGAERADVTFRTAPSIGLRRNSGRLRFAGQYSPVVLGFLNDTREESLFNVLNATGSYEVVDSRAFIEGKALISQAFLSPFGSQPSEFATGSLNRTEVRTLNLSPYVKGRFGDGGSYLLRSDNSYTSFTAQSTLSITTTGVSGEVSGSKGSLVSLGANGYYTLSSYGSGANLTNQSASLRASLNADPEFVPFVTAGYESNEYFLTTFQGPRYGGGFKWQPSPRTSVDIGVEKRYFGTSFNVDMSYRTRLSLWSLRAYRTDRVTPIAGGFGFSPVSTREFLTNLLRSQYTDEAERQIAVERLISTGLLPSTLTQQSALSSPRVLLLEGFEPSVAITGARNTALVTVYWRRNTPISGNGALNVTDVFNTVNGFEQVGASLSWTHQFTPQTSSNAGVDQFSTKSIRANALQPADLTTDQTVFRIFFTHDIAANTTATAGVRFTRLVSESSVSTTIEARERVLQFGVVHKFF